MTLDMKKGAGAFDVRDRSLHKPRCAGCGESFDHAGWMALVLSARVEVGELRRMLLDWPENLCIEVRCCAHCGNKISAKCDAP